MIFSEDVIEAKQKHADDAKNEIEIIKAFLESRINGEYTIEIIEKEGNGGGATLFHIKGSKINSFLKVKNKTVFVESKLEEESEYIHESALYHEYRMLEEAQNANVSVPRVLFYGCDDKYDYLATEYICDCLLKELEKCDIEKLIELWNDLEQNVKRLFENDIVHTDIHEHNIMCQNGKIVLIDFEEARFLNQNVSFEDSLDYCGYNEKSNVGLHPCYMLDEYGVPYTCLNRMKELFKDYMVNKIVEFSKECNYDSTNGICNTLDHGLSNKIYQGINNKYMTIAGQRNADERIYYIEAVCDYLLPDKRFDFIDVGSNNGLFCREMAKYYENKCNYYGLEGTHNFNILAKGLAFLEDAKNTKYVDFICGEDSLDDLHIEGECVFTICSVWHHILKKDQFLSELKKRNIRALILEMAVQDKVYDGKGWKEELKRIENVLEFKGEYILSYSNDYMRPLVLITPNEITQKECTTIKEKISTRLDQVKKQQAIEQLSNTTMYEEYVKRKRNSGNQYIVCYGAGNCGKKAMDFIGALNIVFYIDNNKKETGFSEHKVLTQEQALRIIDDDTTIIVSIDGELGGKIKNQLNKLGIKKVRTLNEALSHGYIKTKRLYITH